MKSRNLMLLAAVLVVLVLAAVLSQRAPQRTVVGGLRAGASLLPALDVNAVAGLELRDGTNTVRLARQEGRWVVTSLWNYPADFEKLADHLRTLANLKAGEVMAGGDKYLKEFGLTAVSNRTPLELRLSTAAGQELAALTVGSARMRGQNSEYGGYADGTYVRSGAGPVVLVKDALAEWPRQPVAWIKSRVLELSRDEIARLSGTVSNQTWVLTPSNSTFQLQGLGTNEDLTQDAVDGVVNTLTAFSVAGVADPARPDAELGLAQPQQLDVTTQSGLNYVCKLGAGASTGRWVRLTAAYLQPAAPTNFVAALASATNAAASNQVVTLEKEYKAKVASDTKKAQDQNALFRRFAYLVTDEAGGKLLPARNTLAKVRPPPAPATSVAPAAMPEK
ncbi:MAG: DUF4340 domain-containing protein [Kiritimatiellaeota bacterium]|nr:DUF4340 domain-containing protein [Kiritimatiellota bacterium]